MSYEKHEKLHTEELPAEEEKEPAMPAGELPETENEAPMSENEASENASAAEQEGRETAEGEASENAPAAAPKDPGFADLAENAAQKKKQEEKRKKRMWWIKTALLIALIGLSIYTLFPITKGITGENAVGFVDMVKGANLPFFLVLLLVIVLYILSDSFQYSYILKTSTGKFRFKSSVKVALLGKYYDAVTPLGTGGQPFQIYYLHKKDIPKGIATAVPLVKYTFSTFAKGILSVIFFAIAYVILPYDVVHNPGFTAIYVLAWVSMVVNMVIPVIMIFGSLFPKAGKKLIIRIIALLTKMHIVKRKYKVTKKYVNEMSEYRRSLKEILKRWWIIIPLLIFAIATALINFSIPFFTVTALANTTPTWHLWAQMFCGGLLAYYSASLLPTPGNSGGIEATSMLVFASILLSLSAPVSAWIIIVWRFLTYYVYILTGIGINVFEIIRSAVRNRRAKKQGI